MKYVTRMLCSVTVAAFAVTMTSLYLSADKAGYQPFPSDPVYEYPTAWSVIHDWIEKADWAKVRVHGWRLFVGANQPAPSPSDFQLRVFETWYTLPETFAAPAKLTLTADANTVGTTPASASTNGNRKYLNRLETANYGNHAVRISPNYTSTCKFAGKRFLNNGDLMIAGVYFSE